MPSPVNLAIRLDSSLVRSDARGAGEKAAEEFSEAFKENLEAVLTGIVGVAAVKEAFDEIVKGTIQLQDATARAAAAARNAGVGVGEFGEAMEGARKQGEALGFSTLDLTDAFGSLVTQTHDVAESQERLKLAQDVARYSHVSLAQAVSTVNLTYLGQTRQLQQFGIQLAGTGSAQERLAAVTLLHNAVQGQAAAHMDTIAGRLDALKGQYESVAESIGGKLQPAISGVLSFMQEHFTGIGHVATALAGLWVANKLATDGMEAARGAIASLSGETRREAVEDANLSLQKAKLNALLAEESAAEAAGAAQRQRAVGVAAEVAGTEKQVAVSRGQAAGAAEALAATEGALQETRASALAAGRAEASVEEQLGAEKLSLAEATAADTAAMEANRVEKLRSASASRDLAIANQQEIITQLEAEKATKGVTSAQENLSAARKSGPWPMIGRVAAIGGLMIGGQVAGQVLGAEQPDDASVKQSLEEAAHEGHEPRGAVSLSPLAWSRNPFIQAFRGAVAEPVFSFLNMQDVSFSPQYAQKHKELVDKQLAEMVREGHVDDARKAYAAIAGQAKDAGVRFTDTAKGFPEYNAAVKEATGGTGELSEAAAKAEQQLAQMDLAVKRAVASLGELNARGDANKTIMQAFWASHADVNEAVIKSTADFNAAMMDFQQERVDRSRAERDARFSDAQAHTEAIHSEEEAEYSQAQAVRSSTQAQKDLTLARYDAINNLHQLNNAVRDIGDNHEAASIRLARAKLMDIQTSGLPSDNLDRRQALLELSEAQKAVADQDWNAAEARRKADYGNQLGVEGSQTMIDAHNRVSDAAHSVQDAEYNLTQTRTRNHQDLIHSHEALDRAITENSTNMDENTGSGAKNVQQQLKLIDAAKTRYLADLDQAGGDEKLRKQAHDRFEAALEDIIKQGGQADLSKQKIEDLITKTTDWHNLSPVEVMLNVLGEEDAEKKMQKLLQDVRDFADLFGIKLDKAPGGGAPAAPVPNIVGPAPAPIPSRVAPPGGVAPPPVNIAPPPVDIRPPPVDLNPFHHAAGGPVSGGRGGVDDVPALLTEDEHVWTVDEVRAAGGHGAVKAMRDMVAGRYAEGGPVGTTGYINVDAAAITQRGIDAVRALMGNAMASVAPAAVPGAAASAGGSHVPSNIGSVLSWLHSVDPLPYVLGGVGPSSYDCSGLVGEVWARLTGNPSYRRYFVTGGEEQFLSSHGFKPGAGTFTVGFSGEHTMGMLAGVPFEAQNPRDGIHIGSGTSNIMRFPKIMYLPGLGGSGTAAPTAVSGGGIFGQILNHILAGGGGDTSGGGRYATSGSPRQAQDYARSQLGRYGWSDAQMAPLLRLWNQESSWNDEAVNRSSGAYGIPQALPSAQGHPYNLGDYQSQINWGLNYIKGRYGSPGGAWAHETEYNWYDDGGWLWPGQTGRSNASGPEAVLTPEESTGLKAAVRQGPVELGADTIRRLVAGVTQALQTRPHVAQIDGRTVAQVAADHMDATMPLSGLVW